MFVIILACCCRRKRRQRKKGQTTSSTSRQDLGSDENTPSEISYTRLDRTNMTDTYDRIGCLDNSNLPNIPNSNRGSVTPYELLIHNSNSNIYDPIQTEHRRRGQVGVIALVHDRSAKTLGQTVGIENQLQQDQYDDVNMAGPVANPGGQYESVM
ncbi:hypothetical protein DPMN_175249 [Dreissena polymorpha]|uniref:Uncharacterized protein n=1 Tax=Dreissena polymorpha TaxID=45954 RepID=A0A9D4E6W4_DREPO|nr:hypothetical protein DPMN_175249 [Dreissena polymorpha]